MAKQLNIDLNVRANASQAQAELKKLQQDLYKIMNMSSGSSTASGLKEASAAAKELTYHLNQAYNTSTGNIDLSKLNSSLQKSQTNISQLSDKLLQAGNIGQSAFLNLAKAISKADYPMFKLNSKLTEMWTTLKNTARWQLSSSVLHGFMGAVQQATGYVQNLDKSLNNIQIVTNKSNDDMARFAENANRAAKALSTTTTAYSDASLIYFQQGLDEEQVEERTAITIKMAQAAGEDATAVSSYMTAIWNNFDDGSRSLESFGDSMARLGADTAASSAEIAAGLEKFASIGQTVGLSFDYAAAAVTTIVDQTREAPETVGNALKTIFARLQGLQMGETLEDGVDLNKYSKALKAVGIEILDLNGEMKDADVIVSELGAKWDTLSRAQQTALSQTVAGVRQYTHLMSWMNNYDEFLTNVERSKNATGTLEEQAAIFADSWEAARKRVQTAAEGIYDSLLNRDLLKDYNNVLADILTGIENIIDGVGGLGGVISSVGTFALSFISHKIQPAIQGFILNVKNLFTSTQDQARSLVSSFKLKNVEQIKSGKYDTEEVQGLRNANILAEARARLSVASKNLTDQEAQLYQQDVQLMEANAQRAEQIAGIVTGLQNQAQTMIDDTDVTEANTNANRIYNTLLKERIELYDEAFDKASSSTDDDNANYENYKNEENAIEILTTTKEKLNTITNDLIGTILNEKYVNRDNAAALEQMEKSCKAVTEKTKEMIDTLNAPKDAKFLDGYKSSLEMTYKSMPKIIRESKGVYDAFKKAFNASSAEAFNESLAEMKKAIGDIKIEGKDINKIVQELNPQQYKEFAALLKQLADHEKKLKEAQLELNAALAGFNPQHFITGTERIVALASAFGQAAMMGSALNSIVQAWRNEDLSFGEQLSTTLLSISTLVPGVISSFNSLKTVIEGTELATMLQTKALKKLGVEETVLTAQETLLTLAKKKQLHTDEAQAAALVMLTGLLKAEGIVIDDNTASEIQNKIATEMANGASLKEAIVTALTTVKMGENTVVTKKNTAAKIAARIAADGLGASLKALLGPIGLVIAAITAIVAGFKIWTKVQEEKAARDLENRKQASEAAIEEAKMLEEERKKVESLYTEYINLQNSLDGSVESKEALKSKTEELCAALGVEWDALDKLQGKYDDLSRQMLEARKIALLENIGKLQNDIGVAGEYVEDTVDKISESNDKFSEYDFGMSTDMRPSGEVKQDEWWNIDQWFDGNDTYQPYETYTHAYLHGGGATNTGPDNTEVRNLFYDWMYENYSDILQGSPIAEDASNYGNRGHSILKFNEGVQEEDIVAAVKEFSDYLLTNKNQLGVNTDSAAYGWFKSFNGDATVEEQIAAIDGMNEELLASVKELAQVEAELAGMEIAEIDNVEEFEAYKTQWMANFRQTMSNMGIDVSSITDDALNDIAEEFLGKYSNISDIITKRDVSKSISKETGIPVDKVKEIAAEYEDFLSLVPEINFDVIDSEEKLRLVLDMLQAKADANKIEAKVETVDAAKGNLKKNMSYGDYMDFETSSGINWGKYDEDLKNEIISYNTFLAMSYEAQVQYLESLSNDYTKAQISNVQTSITANKELLADYQNTYTAAAEYLTQLQNGETLDANNMHLNDDELKKYLLEMQSYQNMINELETKKASGQSLNRDEAMTLHNAYGAYAQYEKKFAARMESLHSSINIINEKLPGLENSSSLIIQNVLSEATSLADLMETVGVLNKDGASSRALDLQSSIEDMQNKIIELEGNGLELGEAEQIAALEAKIAEQQGELSVLKAEFGEDILNADRDRAVDYDAYAEALINLSSSYENCTEESSRFEATLERFHDTLKTDDEEMQNAAKTALEMAEADLKASIMAAEMAEQYDLNAEHIERYAEELESSGNYTEANDKALVHMAKDQLRFDKAVASGQKNMKKWNEALKTANKTGHLSSEAADEMAEAYGDLLDITGSNLSSTFLSNTENLKDLELALKGDEEAYTRLQEAARKDIAARIGIDDSEFQEKFSQLMATCAMPNLDEIKVGASLNNADFLTGLSEMVTAAGMTAQEATDYLSSMGVDAEVVTEEPQTVTETVGYNLTPKIETVSGPFGLGSISFSGVTYDKEPVTTEKQVTGTALKVTSASKSSGGNIKASGSNVNPNNQSGGGGGGDRKVTMKGDQDRTRYHSILNQLEDLESQYDAISKAKDRAFGKDKLSLMDAQINKTQDLIDKQREYLMATDENGNFLTGTIADNLDTDLQVMQEYWKDLTGGQGPAMDLSEGILTVGGQNFGNIGNYDEIEQYMQEELYNKKAAAYEAGTLSEEDWQAFELEYEAMEKYIEQYEETYDLFRDEYQKLQELEMQKIDEKLEQVEYKIELKINLAEDDLALIDQALSRIEEKAFASAERINLQTQKIGNLYEQISISSQALQETLSASGISQTTIDSFLATGKVSLFDGATLTESQMEAIRNHRDSLLDLNNQLLEVKNSIQEEFITVFDEYTESIERNKATIEHYTSVLESYRNIVDIVGKDVLGVSDELMAQMTATTVENAIDAVEANKAHLDTLIKQRDEAYDKMHDKSLSEEDRAFWEEQYNTLNEAAQEAQQELLASWETSLEAIVTQFEEAVQTAVDTFGKAFYDGGLEKLSNDFSFAQDQDDMYLEDYQKIYELSKLTRDINKSIDDTKTIAGKQKLKTLMEDINKLQEEGVEMSEYDLEYLQAEYDLRLAEIALEEAQRAKDTVRLSRDSEGNFSYVYTQNSDAVDEAQQKYEDALYSMQDLSSNYIDEMSAKLIETSQAMQEELASLRIQDYASIDDYYAAVAEVEAKYQKQLSSQEAELNKAIGNNKELYDQDWQNYAAATGYKISATEDFVTSWGDTSLAQMMGLEDGTSFSDIMAGATDGLVQGLLAAAETYYQNIDKANSAAGTHTGQFAAMLESEIQSIETESEKAAEAVSKMAGKMDEALDDVMKKITDWQTTHGKTIDAIIEANTKGIESFNALIDYLSGDIDATVDYSINGKVTTADGDTITGTPISLDGAATGGYTGEWGNYGKLAWIHQKELILNESDTANMLKLVEMTRQMISVIDTKAQQLSQGLGTPVSTTFTDNENDVLEQYVEIKADFPNVNNHTEIEEALNNLINTASQYAHRRKP